MGWIRTWIRIRNFEASSGINHSESTTGSRNFLPPIFFAGLTYLGSWLTYKEFSNLASISRRHSLQIFYIWHRTQRHWYQFFLDKRNRNTLHHKNKGPMWDRIMKKGGQNLLTLLPKQILRSKQVHSKKKKWCLTDFLSALIVYSSQL